jgi:hypothetical protein
MGTTRLVDLPADAFDVLVSVMLERHIARLLATGDKTLCDKVVQLRRGKYDVRTTDSTESQLVKSIMVANAREAIVTLAHLSLDGTIKYDKLARLVIGGTSASLTDEHTDLSFMTALQTLEVDTWSMNGTPVKLPLSVTSVKLRGVICSEPIENLEAMPLLTHLALTSKNGQVDLFQSKWPASLTSLKLVLDGVDDIGDVIADDCYTSLPDSLRQLHLGLFGASHGQSPLPVIDLSLLCDHLANLESARMDGRLVKTTVSRPLPPTLTSLVLKSSLAIGLSDFAALLPASLTRIGVGYCQPEQPDQRAALRRLLPMMDLVDIERLYSKICTWICLQSTNVFADVLRTRFRLPPSYLIYIHAHPSVWMYNTPKLTIRRAILLMEIGMTDEELDVVLATKRPYFDTRFDLLDASSGYTSHFVPLLERGMVDVLHVIPGVISALQSKSWRLPARAIGNVFHLVLDVNYYQQLMLLLEKNSFECVVSMHITRDRNSSAQLASIWEVVVNHRHRLPRLESVTWVSQFGSDVTDDERALMAEVSFYPTGKYGAVFRVAPPRPNFVSISAALE